MGGLGVRTYLAYRELEVCSVLGRGVSFHVKPWIIENEADLGELGSREGASYSEDQEISNTAIFTALCEELASRHIALLFRSLMGGDSTGQRSHTAPPSAVYDYWALIPPLPTPTLNSCDMVLCRLYSHDDLLLPCPPPTPHPPSLEGIVADAREQVGVCLDSLLGGQGEGRLYEPQSFLTGRWDHQVVEMLQVGRAESVQNTAGGYVHHSIYTPAPTAPSKAIAPSFFPVTNPSHLHPHPIANPAGSSYPTAPQAPSQPQSGRGASSRGGRGSRGRGGFQTASSVIDQGGGPNQIPLSLQPKGGPGRNNAGRGGEKGRGVGNINVVSVTPPPPAPPPAPSHRPYSPPLENTPPNRQPALLPAPPAPPPSHPPSPKMHVGRLLRRKVGGSGATKAPVLSSWNDSDEELAV
eukprot:gene26845-32444_t